MTDEPSPDAVVITDGETTWRFDPAFLTSAWRCSWGDGCKGILDRPTPELQQGCCSLGAELDNDEARMLSAMTAMLDPTRFQHHAAAADGVFGPFSDDEQGWRTRVVDGACILLNRPGFEGGEGCALHLEAVTQGESPIDWKPGVCWQLPLHVDWALNPDGTETATMRGWRRGDWGEHGTTMAWCCTEDPTSYDGDRPVVDSLGPEIEAMVGHEVYVELRSRLAD